MSPPQVAVFQRMSPGEGMDTGSRTPLQADVGLDDVVEDEGEEDEGEGEGEGGNGVEGAVSSSGR